MKTYNITVEVPAMVEVHYWIKAASQEDAMGRCLTDGYYIESDIVSTDYNYVNFIKVEAVEE